jgi:DNA-binding transcriptional LysR family regulator
MQIAHLRTFVNVIERGGFSTAAQALGISQPAVSQQVQRLEAELGVTLLRRGRRGVVAITPSGERVLGFARTTLAAYDALQEELDRLQGVIAGQLRLAASTIPGEYLVPQLLTDFRARYPNVEPRVVVSGTADVVRPVLAGECDLGFIGAPVERPGLAQECLAADQVVLAVYPEHLFAEREQVTWEEVLTQPLIVREQGSGTRRTVERALASQGKRLRPESVALTLGSTQAVVQAIRDQLGIGFVSQRAIVHASSAERLSTVEIEGLRFTRHLFIIYETTCITSPLLRTFLAFVRETASGWENDSTHTRTQ